MLKKTVTYENFNGDAVTESFYFHFSKAELIEMEVNGEGGSLSDQLKKIITSEKQADIVNIMKKIVLDAYGEKSADGKYFVKNEEVRERFSQTAAYSDIFMSLATEDKAAAEFMAGLLPKGLLTEEELEAAKAGDTSVLERPQTQDHQKPRQSITATIAEPSILQVADAPQKSAREIELEAQVAALRAQQLPQV